ncbi:Tubulin-folding cofactor C [Lecanosticta acicola]|uniref:Tubulin-folding cofactor C n=1 Tax=Lecanosticta acicola TaxID=111012 RepID=A0AAI8Z6X1_9PEZI|nr:Tubulin-folding cofactor C [Lecanosticta acicola]
MATATPGEQQPAAQLTPTEKFFRFFQHEVTDLRQSMERIKGLGAIYGERSDAIDHCRQSISRLSSEVQDASSYLPAYDQRAYSDTIKALNTKLQEVREAGAPRQKFSFNKSGAMFTAKKNESAISLNDAAELARQRQRQISGPVADRSNDSSCANTPASNRTPEPEKVDEAEAQDSGTEINQPGSGGLLAPETARVRTPSFSGSKSVTIGDRENVHIVLPTAASHATSSATVSNLRHSVVDMSQPTTQGQPFATLTLKNIKSSLVVCGHVSGAAHLTNIRNSVIVVACRQFRMHESSNCDVYLLSTSRPIIEDCSAIRFAPLPNAYMRESDRDTKNQWSNVDDFKWLRNEPSPHWSPMEPSERIADNVWKDIVPGGPELGVENVLEAVNVPK